MPIFFSFLPLMKPLRVRLDDEERDALVRVRRVGIGLGGDDAQIAEDAVRDERLARR